MSNQDEELEISGPHESIDIFTSITCTQTAYATYEGWITIHIPLTATVRPEKRGYQYKISFINDDTAHLVIITARKNICDQIFDRHLLPSEDPALGRNLPESEFDEGSKAWILDQVFLISIETTIARMKNNNSTTSSESDCVFTCEEQQVFAQHYHELLFQ